MVRAHCVCKMDLRLTWLKVTFEQVSFYQREKSLNIRLVSGCLFPNIKIFFIEKQKQKKYNNRQMEKLAS